VKYIISAKEQYIKRYDKVYAQMHLNICNEIGVKLKNKHWYENVLKSVETSHEAKVNILGTNKCKPADYS
jgi:hypothetical protein